MLSRVLLLCSVLFLRESFGLKGKYNDFFFKTKFNGSDITWMVMPSDNGVAVTAFLEGVTPEQNASYEDVELLLWTRDNQENPERMTFEEDNTKHLKFKKFDASKKTIILIHGFSDPEKEPEFFNTLVPAFLHRGDYNVIGINWRNLSSIPWYAQAVENSVFVGEVTAKAITAARRRSRKHTTRIHVVAHNLGLDPPNILTNDLPDNRKLDKDDAYLVEIVHTSGDYIGINDAVGHRDFYPNDGKWPQPGCTYDIADRCSMRRAYYYYAEAVYTNNSYLATRCSSYRSYLCGNCQKRRAIPLYNSASKSIEGKFYLKTKSTSPYYMEEVN